MNKKHITYICGVLAILVSSLPVTAQNINADEIDASVRAAKSNSIMFRSSTPEEQMQRQAYEEEMKRRAEYEQEMQRRAYEEEMKRREEALRPVNLFGNSLKIFAEVNGEIITSQDMQERVNAFVVTTQIPVNEQTKNMIINKVLEAAIDEKIKLQEAYKNSVVISEAELDKGVQNFADANKISVPELKRMLRKAQVNEAVFRSQMKAEMAWVRLVQKKAAQNTTISQTDIDDAIESIKKDVQQQKFMVSEIVIPKKKAKDIELLVENLRYDPRFELYAMQFSESLSAKNGGRLGWINKGQLALPLEKAILKMKEGEISNPVLYGTDYYILRLEKIYTPGVDKAPIPNEDEIRKMLENKKLEEIAEKYIRDLRNKAIINRKA